MAHSHACDPLAPTLGLVPRYVRERRAADALAAARAAATVPPAVVQDSAGRRLDGLTADLRHRIATVGEPRRSVLALTAPAFAGASVVLGLLLGH